ncbi:hypothetical protein GCM10007079_33130 [Nocardiopsis terrae]|uniref:Uncharacterized protein n=1 Tax=Nocardiopsis terrae TaxID=372655 RepID=A0ABR9HJC9_9ACTN|nr:hypothetical protein [Nocardiopsis terrae]MBE1459126.1 hypothetical protein [Nocardiopsis terrae]GHC88290.1 hypothetical protein GCM10007079_33130 [Nocardiopsis terrae]
MNSNADLAAHLRERANVHPDGSFWRRACLCAATALDTTRTASAAHAALDSHPLPGALRAAAHALVDGNDHHTPGDHG